MWLAILMVAGHDEGQRLQANVCATRLVLHFGATPRLTFVFLNCRSTFGWIDDADWNMTL